MDPLKDAFVQQAIQDLTGKPAPEVEAVHADPLKDSFISNVTQDLNGTKKEEPKEETQEKAPSGLLDRNGLLNSFAESTFTGKKSVTEAKPKPKKEEPSKSVNIEDHKVDLTKDVKESAKDESLAVLHKLVRGLR